MSELGKLNYRDILKGCLMAIIGAVLSALLAMLQNGGVIDFKAVGIGGAVAGISYLLKNLFTNSDDQFLKKENPTYKG